MPQVPHRPQLTAPARRRRIAIPLALSIAGLAAGCGTSSGSPTGGPTGGPPKTIVAAGYKFAACMRSHGVSSFPDPRDISQNGHQASALLIGPSVTSSPAFAAARTACRGILPVPTKGDQGQQSDDSPARVQHVRAFATCMRSHRVPNFPDPSSQGQLTLAMVDAAGVDVHAPAVQAAARTCLPAADGAITAAQVYRAENGAGAGG